MEQAGISHLSSELIQKTWEKAERLLNSPGSICDGPGMKDAMCIASDTGSKPHIVMKTKKRNAGL